MSELQEPKIDLPEIGEHDGDPEFRGQYAGFVSRFLAFYIDFLLLSLIMAVASALINQILEFMNILIRRLNLNPVGDEIHLANSLVVLLIVYGIYFVFFWSVLGTTLGGAIIGLKIVGYDGHRPSIFRALFRFTIEFMIPIFLFIGSFWVLFNPRRQAWYDKLAGTYVIYNWSARPDHRFWSRKSILKFFKPKDDD